MTASEQKWEEIKLELLNNIMNDDGVEILSNTKEKIVLYDYATGQELVFQLEPHTRASIEPMLHIGSSVKISEDEKHKIADAIIKMPPELLMMLRGILIIKTPQDLRDIAEKLNIDDNELPEKIFDEDDDFNEILSQNLVGLYWYSQSMVIVNLAAMRTCIEEIALNDFDCHKELKIGFWTTLIHEIRHCQIDSMPYTVSWIQDNDDKEENVERYAIDLYESLF